MQLDERKYRILQAIIDDYIMTAMPVGSPPLRGQGECLSVLILHFLTIRMLNS